MSNTMSKEDAVAHKQSKLEHWPGSFHWEDTLLSQSLSSPMCMGKLNAGVNSVMAQHPIQEG